MTRFARSSFVRLGLLPIALYFAGLVLLTWPAICSFSSHFFGDQLDGLQNVWNLWWVNKAVTELQQSPWDTTWLHYPHGTTLIGHTLNPFNGFVGIPLATVLSPTQVYNLILTMAFVTTGLFAFWLARYLNGSYWPSIVAGFAFTFSSFHFAHAQGHLNLASLQFVPLFLLVWVRLVDGPTVTRGLLAGLTLGLLVLCDYYYTLFCMLTAGISLIWSLPVLQRRHSLPLASFAVTALLCVGPVVARLLWINAHDPLIGAHPVEMFSTDLPSLLVPGGHWVFHRLTEPYWSQLPGNPEEHNVYLGLTVLGLACYGLTWRVKHGSRSRSPGFYVVVAIVFTVLSLGPVLHAFGRPLTGPILPYAWLVEIFPPLKLTGVPVRMMVMTILSGCVLAAYGLARLWAIRSRARIAIGLGLVCLMVVEHWPRGLALTAPHAPDWVAALRDLPETQGVLVDLDEFDTWLMYYQTVYRKPQAFGYVSRAPASVGEKNDRLRHLYRTGQYDVLRDELHFRYLVARPGSPLPLTPVYRDSQATIYDLARDDKPY